MKKTYSLILVLALFVLSSCTKNNNEIGSKENPLKFYLVPAQDMLTLTEQGKILQKYLQDDLKMEVRVELPTSYIAVVEAFGSNRADAAILNTFGYVLAHEKYQAEARLKLVNRGRDYYNGQIIVRADSSIKSIKDLNGKKFAFVDPVSTSGYLLPVRLFKKENIKIKESIFAGRHDSVVTAVYQKKVDAGATFYTPPDDDATPKDARWIIRTQYPDVFKKVKILQLTEAIPNDPLVLRKGLPEDIKNKLIEALKKYIKTEEGSKVLHKLYHITDFKTAQDADYDLVRGYLKDLGKTAQEFIK
jgi:phosphonate transport system substrate-binding protein